MKLMSPCVIKLIRYGRNCRVFQFAKRRTQRRKHIRDDSGVRFVTTLNLIKILSTAIPYSLCEDLGTPVYLVSVPRKGI